MKGILDTCFYLYCINLFWSAAAASWVNILMILYRQLGSPQWTSRQVEAGARPSLVLREGVASCVQYQLKLIAALGNTT